MNNLFIISNESIFENDNKYFCDNLDMKSTPEGLSDKFEVFIIARKSNKARSHQIKVGSIKSHKNLYSFLIEIFKSFKADNPKYLIFSISPFTLAACILIRVLKKKPIIFLRSDGYGEYKAILGIIGPIIYHLMFTTASRLGNLISCRKYILKGKIGKVIAPSQLNNNWLSNLNLPDLNLTKLLYVGRIRKEKGVFSLLDIIRNNNRNAHLSIVGAEKELKNQIKEKNVSIYEIENNEKKLIKYYDDHNIFVLPSYTEGHPMVLLESLSRLRPIIIFKEIDHIIGDKIGIFVSERNEKSFFEKIDYIKKNYKNIQEEMKKNKLPTKNEFLNEFKKLIVNSN